MEKRIMLGILLIAVFLIGGCTVSDYLTGNQANKSYSLKEDKKDNTSEKTVEDILKELETEDNQSAETTTSTKTSKSTVEKELNNTAVIKLTVKENEKVRLKPKATDPNKDTIKYTFSKPLDPNGEWQTDYGDAGKYYITVTASDGKLTTTKNVLLTVEKVNVAPVISDVKDLTVSEGDTVTLSPKISDPNGDKVTVKISKPIGDDGIWKIDYQKAGIYNINITASDGEKTAVKTVKVTVNKKNMPPAISDLSDITVNEGDTVEIDPKINDVNGDKVKVTISDPVGDDGIWETGYTDHGVYNITVTANDGTVSAKKTITLTVKAVNKAPEIIDIINEKQ